MIRTASASNKSHFLEIVSLEKIRQGSQGYVYENHLSVTFTAVFSGEFRPPSGLSPPPINRKMMQNRRVIQVVSKAGCVLNAFEGDSITVEIQKRGEYDRNALESLRDILGEIRPETSLDVGANIGNHALVISKYSENLIAFEPIKFIFDVLKSNVALNNLSNVEVLNLGLSNKAMDRNIFIPENGNLGTSSLEVMSGEGDFLQVKTVIGDDYLREHHSTVRVDFIKIDVEGHEAAALMGLKETIVKDQPLLLIEWNSPETVSSFKEFDLFNKLFSGYKAYSLSSTDNKKIYTRSITGFLKRLFFKMVSSKWCFSSFEPEKYYSNVFLVPSRYQSALEGIKH